MSTIAFASSLRRFARRALLAATLAVSLFAAPVHAAEVLVFAAASLKPALDAILATPDAKAIGTIKVSYAASSQLARQIEHGAPAAVFISADLDWMDHVEKLGKLETGTRANLLGNALVLVAPKDSDARVDLAAGGSVTDALGPSGRLAVGEPNSVPAGKYAKAALTSLGQWDALASRAVSADNVRSALNFVARKEAALGIVYRTDALSEPAVRIVDTFPAATHAPIVYPIGLLAPAGDEARKLHALLLSPGVQAAFVAAGFDPRPR